MFQSLWYTRLSTGQRFRLYGTLGIMLLVLIAGILANRGTDTAKTVDVHTGMSIKEIAPMLGVTPKALARELKLPLNVPKRKSLRSLGIQPEILNQSAAHLLSHRDRGLKYYVFVALVFGGFMFLTDLGRPALSDVSHRRSWYPRAPYIAFLGGSVIVAGFLLGKSPNPMEGTVKVFKSMVGLYPDPMAKLMAFFFFIALAVIGNKLICGWACPFGALQELVYSIPVLKKAKRRGIPFLPTNLIRSALFIVVLCILFGVVGGSRGMVLYHYINPFNLFNLDIASAGIFLTVMLALGGSFFFYRPFCRIICPFGLISWIAEKISLFRVRIDKAACTECGACIRACPSTAAEDRVHGKRFPADCFSCARCLNVCSQDAIHYRSVFRDFNENRDQSQESTESNI